MVQLKAAFAATVASAMVNSAYAFDVDAKHVALYWGQNSALNQASLGDYCAQNDADIFLISFLNTFGNGQQPGMNLANACGNTFPGTNMLNCPNIEADIKSCQAQGKIVLMSLGGAYGNYGFASDAEAKTFANDLWSWFGEGGNNSTQRPFGSAVVDGFDLDIEHGGSTGYVSLVNQLRANFKSGSKDYYVSAAPQCPYPDAELSEVFTQADLDFAWIQFYNNNCDANGSGFNYNTWQKAAQTSAGNKNIKLYVGLPGSPSAGSGYLAPSDFAAQLGQAAKAANFGGISLWDASQAYDNVDANGVTYAHAAEVFVDQYNPEPVATTTALVAIASVPTLSPLPTGNVTAPATSSDAAITAASSSGSGPVYTTKEITVTDGTKVYTTTTVCPLTETTPGPAYVTKEITVTEGTKVYTTTTVCPLTETTPGPVYVTKEITVTEGSKVYTTTTVCPLTETTPGPVYVTKEVTVTEGSKVYTTTTVCPLTEGESVTSSVPSVAPIVSSSPVAPAGNLSSIAYRHSHSTVEVPSVAPSTAVLAQESSPAPAPTSVEQSNGAASLTMAGSAVLAMAGMLLL